MFGALVTIFGLPIPAIGQPSSLQPKVSLSPSNISFAGTVIGTVGSPRIMTLKNTGKGALQISTITLSGPHSAEFLMTNGCGTLIAPSSVCTISLAFRPSGSGVRSAAVEISGNAGVRVLTLRGTGTLPPQPTLTTSPTSLAFPSQLAGTESAPKSVTVRNSGPGTLRVSGIGIRGDHSKDFIARNTCGAPIEKGASCNITVNFAPTIGGTRIASVEVTSNAGVKAVSLRGVGTEPKKYTVSVAAGAGGQSIPVSAMVGAGGVTSFKLVAAPGYKLAKASGCAGRLDADVFTTGAISAACKVTVVFAPDPPFAGEPKLLRDLEPLFAQTCGPDGVGRSLQHVIPVDFNKDGRNDLAINIWCSPVRSPMDYSGPTPSRVYIFTQNPKGEFIEDTARFFGSLPVNLGGVGEYYATGDYNRDGYTDIVYSIQREDGRRINSPPITQYAFNMALMSRGDGTYIAQQWGSLAWHSQLGLAANRFGEFDIIETSFSQPAQGWRWQGLWDTVPGYEWVSGTGALFLSAQGSGKGSEFAINAANGALMGVEARKLIGDSWVKTSEFGFPSSVVKKICCGNSGETPAAFTSIDGKDYIDSSFGLFCELKRTPSSSPEAIVDFNAQEIVGGYRGQTIVYGQTELIGADKLFSFSVDSSGSLRRNDLIVRNELTQFLEPNRMACQDFNRDGFQDIVIYATPQRRVRKPVVYLNDGRGEFDRVSEAVLPVAPSGANGYNYILEDVDSDGVRDLVYFPIFTNSPGQPIQIRIHRGLRPLAKSDVMGPSTQN